MKLQQILKVTLNNRLICIHTPPVVYEMPVANTGSSNLRAGGREKCRIVQVKPFFPLTVIGSNTSSLISIFMLRPRLNCGVVGPARTWGIGWCVWCKKIFVRLEAMENHHHAR